MTGALAGQEEADALPASTAPSGHSCAVCGEEADEEKGVTGTAW